MRLLLDENMPGTVIADLRNRGHDVLSVKESMRGMDDPDILAQAQAESRVVVTQDKDFGELAFRIGLPATCGVILLRLAGDDPDMDNRRMVAVVESRTDWSGAFAVATEKRVRVRPLPSAPSP
jgi:predicted nuclease of predicted toxin-antitoxin system